MSSTAEVADFELNPLIIIFSAYVIIIVASLFGNSVIIHIIRTDNSMKNTTNYLILNQACVDILTSVMAAFILINYITKGKWFGGVIGLSTCKLLRASPDILTVVSVWILVTIAVDRFYAVTRPLWVSPISQHFKKAISLLWVWSIVSSSDALAHKSLQTIENYRYCRINVIPSEWMPFYITTRFLNIILPLMVIAVLYTIVCLKLWSREVPGEGTNQNQEQAEAIKTARKVTRMMIVIVVLYLVCWFPLLISVPFGLVQRGSRIFFIIAWFAMAYSGLNPYVYLTFNQTFRNGFKFLFVNCLRKIKIHNVLFSRSQRVELEQI